MPSASAVASPETRTRRTVAGVAALTMAAFVLRWVALRGPDPPGTDGYYYVVQAEHLVADGTLHVPDASWVLRFLALPHALGTDAVAGQAVAAALLAAAVVPAAFALGRRTSPAAAWTLAAWATVSPTIGQLAADFPKSLGLVPPLYALGAAPTLLGIATFGLLAATAHRLGAATVGLAGLGALGGRTSGRVVAAAVGAVLAFGLLAALLPGLLHPEDLDRVTGQLRASPWPPYAWMALRPVPLAQAVELVVLPWGALVAGIAARDRALLPWLVPLAVALFPWWRTDTLDLGYRLALLAPVLAAPIAARFGRRWAPVALLALAPWSGSAVTGAAHPPYDAWRAWIARVPRPLPDLLILEPGAVFLYDHLTGASALGWDPEPGLDRARIERVAWGIRDGEWASLAPADPVARRLDRDHLLVGEEAWEAFRVRALAEGDDDLRARVLDPRNPSVARPASLLRHRPPPSLTAPAPADR